MRDVEGVVGGLAVGPEGSLVVHDLFPKLGPDIASRLAARLRQLHEALILHGGKVGSLDLRFDQLRVQVAPIKHGMVAVLVEHATNSPALSMALEIAANRIQAELALGGAHPA
jgi:predicted regulator of Ras-like GTPase activity (Roadblock/LC7/MglB family)